MTEPKAWECIRCHRINAPHVDRCDCDDNLTVSQPTSPLPPYVLPYYPILPIWISPLTQPDPWQPPYTITCITASTDAGRGDYTATIRQ